MPTHTWSLGPSGVTLAMSPIACQSVPGLPLRALRRQRSCDVLRWRARTLLCGPCHIIENASTRYRPTLCWPAKTHRRLRSCRHLIGLGTVYNLFHKPPPIGNYMLDRATHFRFLQGSDRHWFWGWLSEQHTIHRPWPIIKIGDHFKTV